MSTITVTVHEMKGYQKPSFNSGKTVRWFVYGHQFVKLKGNLVILLVILPNVV